MQRIGPKDAAKLFQLLFTLRSVRSRVSPYTFRARYAGRAYAAVDQKIVFEEKTSLAASREKPFDPSQSYSALCRNLQSHSSPSFQLSFLFFSLLPLG
jgi:hypothetical protein